VETQVISRGEKGALEQAVAVLRAGGLVAFPTDTVYGLAALPADRDAVVRIYEVKSRSSSNPIALLLSDLDQLAEVAVLLEAARPLARRFWPGGLSLVLPKTEAVPDEVTAGPTVAVRVPDLALARSLIEAAGGVLAVTSANRSGEPAALDAEEVLEQLAGQIELVVDGGRCRGGVPSTVLDCTVWPPAIVRHGAVSEAAIQAVLDRARST
jgi:L-threonylcarbamoyladenylate synthase